MNTWLKCLLSAGMGVGAGLMAAVYVTEVVDPNVWSTTFVAVVFLNVTTWFISRLPDIE